MTNNTNEIKKVETTTTITTNKRDFILNENVTESSVKDIIVGIQTVNKHDAEKKVKDPNYKPEPITLIVNSYGGVVYDGLALTSVIDSSETPVHTYCYGKAMSMGFIIFASGHKRFAHPLATFMYHQVANVLSGFTEDIKKGTEQMEVLMETYDAYILANTNMPKHKMDETKKMKENWYIPATEAIHYGLVDELLVSKRNR
ncbi:ATP-dependent protease [Bacillus phage vB_BanS_Nate]|uniref:ATP-dependent Clp protease proteolytic subunit n=1 Tax=Bacillus phage vB_BanS_Nate TaxID=2894788 RepID=A0AAE8YUH0_9CAUD|nr:ATP-dependent protease [Bacillus phage vB_BanS_Nate]UGO51028.1 ATP-dependent Clp protease proteolytic subunit [Bacillus phage vB_BanS_Nate]